MTQLYLHSFNRRSTLVDHDGVRSCQTERVNQLLSRGFWRYIVVEEEVVPSEEFIPVMLDKSTWKSRFETVDAKPVCFREEAWWFSLARRLRNYLTNRSVIALT